MVFLRIAALAVCILAPFVASAAPVFQLQAWSVTGLSNYVPNVEGILSSTTAAPDVTFESATVPNLSGSGTTSIYSLLGSPTTGFSGSKTTKYQGSIFLITGFIDLLAGDHSFSINADDGLRLTIGGTDVFYLHGGGSVTKTTSVTGGVMAFRLLYWLNGGGGYMNLTIDGKSASAAAAPGSEVPLPAAGMLLITALGGLGGVSAFRRRAA